MITASDLWPPSGIMITEGELTLSPVRDDDLPGLVELALDGIHAPDFMPFYVPWTRASPEVLPREFAQFHWGVRSTFSTEEMHLEFAVRVDGELVGCQGASGRSYPILRTVETGSWLAQRHQGRGLGTRMRRAVCAFLFDHLGAAQVTSGAWADNGPSLAVSRKVGYRENGRSRRLREDAPAEHVELRLLPDDFVRGAPVGVTGAEPLRRFLGIAD